MRNWIPGKAGEEITKAIEDQISAKVINVLGPIYGNGECPGIRKRYR